MAQIVPQGGSEDEFFAFLAFADFAQWSVGSICKPPDQENGLDMESIELAQRVPRLTPGDLEPANPCRTERKVCKKVQA